MAASSGIVFAEALLGRDGRVSAQPGAWYPEEVLSLNRVEASLRWAGIDVMKTDHDQVGTRRTADIECRDPTVRRGV